MLLKAIKKIFFKVLDEMTTRTWRYAMARPMRPWWFNVMIMAKFYCMDVKL